MKSRIIERLGHDDILLPALIAEGLAANDRVKVRLSVLQALAGHAREPRRVRFDLTDECRMVGLDPVAMEALVHGAAMMPDGRISAPGLDDLMVGVWDDVTAMARAVAAGDAEAGEAALARLAALRDEPAAAPADTVDGARVSRLTALSDAGGDGLHRLVMELHKALNALAAAHAGEVVDGAHAYGLLPEDRPALEAFMAGLAATRALKFDHPGLSTVATRSGARLTIQNDIGETEAHVVVIAVEADAVTLTYSDVHLARTKFFTGLLRDFSVRWSGLDRRSAEGLGEDGVFYLVTGRCPTADGTGRDAFLEAVGASLVFLIDWNKARKVLRAWIPKRDAARLLDWAARERVGHRGFLALGGNDLVASAVRHAAPARIGFGERLDESLGRDAAVDFLKTVLQVATATLLHGGSVRQARDRIEAELVRHLQRADSALLAIVVRQAGLAREIAAALARDIAERAAQRPFDRTAMALQARRIEEKADKIAIEARSEIMRLNADPMIERLVNGLEDAIDDLEQAAFVASLVPMDVQAAVLERLGELCAAAIDGAEAAASGTVAAAEVPEGNRVDSEDALAAVDRLIEVEHRADAAERAITAMVLGGDFDLRTALSVLDLARTVERATDRLAGFGHLLRGHVLADLQA